MADGQPTVLPEAGAPDVLYLIDISGYLFRAYHALPPLSSPGGEPTHAVLGVTTMLRKLIDERRPSHLAVAMDSRTKSFRHEIYDQYKANRPPAPEDLKLQMGRVAEIVAAYRIPVLQQDGVEADDVIASAVRRATEAGLRVVIVSADKDLLQLVSDTVLMYDTSRNRVFGAPETQKKLGVLPERVGDYLALVGDSSDNVPGVPSVGPKTAVKLLDQFGTLEALLGNLDAVEKKGLKQKLQDHVDVARLSRELVALREDVPLAMGAREMVPGEPEAEVLRGLFEELGFSRLLAQLPGGSGAAKAPTGAAAEPANFSAEPPFAGEVTLIGDLAGLSAVAAALARCDTAALFSVTDGPRALGASVVGLGVAVSPTEAFYIPLEHQYLGRPDPVSASALVETLGPAVTRSDLRLICSDAKRELLSCAVLGLPRPHFDVDLNLASYLVDAERHGHSVHELAQELLGHPVAAQEVLLPKRRSSKAALPSQTPVEALAGDVGDMVRAMCCLRDPLMDRVLSEGAESLLRDLELPLSGVLAAIEQTGIRVDVQHLQRMSQRVAEQLVTLEARCTELAGHAFNVASPRQLETILFDELQLPVIKRTKTARSTDHSVLEELSMQHELPEAILEHRMLAKLKNTYLDALPREVDPKTGRIHTDFRQTVAATGRLSSTEPNLQNIPIRTEIGRSIRDAFVPRDGWSLLSVDYSQIELRVLAHLSRDPELIDAFSSDADVHVRTATALFGVDPQDVTREMRGQAKTVNFAVIYGQTQFALARNLRIARAEAGRYIKAFFARYAGVQAYMDRVVEEGREQGAVRTLCGRVRKLPELNSRNRVRRQAAERVARNTPIQGTAADIIKLAMIAVDRAMLADKFEAKMLLTVHDELVFEAPDSEREALEATVRRCMEGVMPLDVPLKVDSGWGHTWGEAH